MKPAIFVQVLAVTLHFVTDSNCLPLTLYNNVTAESSSFNVTLNASEGDLLTRYQDLHGVHRYCNDAGSYMATLYTGYGYTGDAICTYWNRPFAYCRSLPEKFAGKIRSAFLASDMLSTVTVFSEPNFDYTSSFIRPINYSTTPDILNIGSDILSIRINGGIPVTVFERPYYQGFRKCYSHIDGIGVCINDVRNEGFTSVQSMKLGMCIE